MKNILDRIDEFANFAKAQVVKGEFQSLDDLYDQWREQVYRDEDFQAIQASLRDMENGETGRPLQTFLAEFDTQQSKKGIE